MRKRISPYIVRREDGKWILEWDEEVVKIERVRVVLKIKDPDDTDEIKREVSELVGCYPDEVKIDLEG